MLIDDDIYDDNKSKTIIKDYLGRILSYDKISDV